MAQSTTILLPPPPSAPASSALASFSLWLRVVVFSGLSFLALFQMES